VRFPYFILEDFEGEVISSKLLSLKELLRRDSSSLILISTFILSFK